MLVGPVFTREVTTTPRSWRHYLSRALYVSALFGLVLTAWLILIGSQQVRSLGDLSRFGSAVFALLAPLQMAMAVIFSALLTAAAVAQEKDRRTFDLLLMTNLSNAELVLGKLLASMLSVLVLVVAAIPLLMLITLLGGVSFGQVARVVAVTLTAAAVAGSLGSMIALWREKTFQSLALTALLLVFWVLVGEGVAGGLLGDVWAGATAEQWAAALSPLRAILAAMVPFGSPADVMPWCRGPVNLFLILSIAATLLINLWAILRVRVWNPTQAVVLRHQTTADGEAEDAEGAAVEVSRKSREVWDNPILWREIRTWAYGRKIILVRLAYLVIFAICAAALFGSLAEEGETTRYASLIVPAAKPLVPLMVLGLVLVNALAVTSLTNERDLQALDLLLVTDLTPKEIIYGKLGGVFYNSKEIILLPLVLCGVLWYTNHLSTENLVFLTVVMLVMNAFVAVLGIHSGMTYFESRTAVGVSLSTVLFLLLGIAVCMRMMLAFQSSFTYQLQAFAAFMLGGGAGLFLALGYRNPSRAIWMASFGTPFATFYVITSFLQSNFGAAFIVAVTTYGFATAAMLVPAVDEFDVATGRTTSQDG
ncbi:MAG: ABC transporter permease subunit [Planctomycetes bacterium]|nr:ABC transporter permease subunit [Planctomycetota bacterium]